MHAGGVRKIIPGLRGGLPHPDAAGHADAVLGGAGGCQGGHGSQVWRGVSIDLEAYREELERRRQPLRAGAASSRTPATRATVPLVECALTRATGTTGRCSGAFTTSRMRVAMSPASIWKVMLYVPSFREDDIGHLDDQLDHPTRIVHGNFPARGEDHLLAAVKEQIEGKRMLPG